MNRPRATAGSAVTAAIAAIVTVVVVILLTADTPFRTLSTVLIGPWANRYALGNLLSRASMLMLTGAGVVVAFRAGVFNLGGEGQVYAAAVLVTVLLTASPLPTWLSVALAVGGAAGIAGLSGWLKHRTGADELITSFLLSAAIFPVLDYLLAGPLRDPDSSLLASRSVPEAVRLMRLLAPSSLNTGAFWALGAVATLWIVLRRTLFGYELRIVGYNRRLARYAGMPVGLYTTVPMALSGLLHGAAGVILVLGVHHKSIAGFSGGLGWNGLAVALIARNHPLLLIPAAIFFAFLESGARAAVLQNQTTWELGSIVQAVVFLFVTADIVIRRRGRMTRSSAEESDR
ncbi:MAG: ABC transporter permease [Spirochaetales bacterium]|nr:ABC transporter permease [Spirochaetales bacterium]